MNTIPRIIFGLGLSFLVALAFAQPGAHATAALVVNHTGNGVDVFQGDGICADANGKCTLRAALQEANALAGADTITFNIPGPGPHTIQPATSYPGVVEDVNMLNNSGEVVILQGGGTAQPMSGNLLFFYSNVAATISNLTIRNFHFFPSEIDGFFGGAGIENYGALTLNGVTLSNNSVRAGGTGGAIRTSSSLTIINSTISGNSATRGGGIGVTFFGQPFTLTITASTITGNDGGGIYMDSLGLLLRNTIVADNYLVVTTAPSEIAGFADPNSSFNLMGDAATSGGLINGVNNNQVGVANPGLGPLAWNGGLTQTHALLPASPAIDKGLSFALTNDQRGSLRPVDIYNVIYPNAAGGDGADIGAFELLPQPANKDQCKNDGWRALFRANATRFKNQGDCIQYVNTGK